MQKIKLLIAISILLLTAIACNALALPTTPAPQPPPTIIIELLETPTAGTIPLTEADVPRASLEQAISAAQAGAAVIVDVRNTEAYEASHIEGAISIPLNEIESNPNSLALEKDQWIITYCT